MDNREIFIKYLYKHNIIDKQNVQNILVLIEPLIDILILFPIYVYFIDTFFFTKSRKNLILL